MNYPFFYKVLFKIDPTELLNSIERSENYHTVWGDWVLEEINSELLATTISNNFCNLEVYLNKFFISRAKDCNLHIDRFQYFHLLHRILIPLTGHFDYEWIYNEKKTIFTPEPGQVILFNNMIPHKFISHAMENITREVVYFDLIDPKLKPFIKYFEGNYSFENGILAAQEKS